MYNLVVDSNGVSVQTEDKQSLVLYFDQDKETGLRIAMFSPAREHTFTVRLSPEDSKIISEVLMYHSTAIA